MDISQMANKKQEILKTVESLTGSSKTKGIAFAEFGSPTTNPWTDPLRAKDKKVDYDEYVKLNSLCRFFYKSEPVVSTVVNKLVEIGINDLVFSRNGLSDNEFRLFAALKPRLLEFAEQMAQEFLLSGLVVPEIGFEKNKDKQFIFSLGVKKYSSLTLPESMTLRDPSIIKIKTSWLGDKPSFFIKIPEEIIKFIKNKGKYADGKEDKELYESLLKQFPDFVKAVNKGDKELPLVNDNIIRRKYTADNPYPIPYISPSLDALQHKRKLRRMDYTLIDKIIGAILHVKIGSDEFPITDGPEDQEYIDELRTQLRMRANSDQLMERIFQLFTNHTVELNWIFPNAEILLNDKKYEDINQEILFGLGFPRTLITGEAAKTGTSDPEIATLAPVKTMENFRGKVIEVIRDICTETSLRNGFKSAPTVEFAKLNLYAFRDLLVGLEKLYNASALSRTDLARTLGYDFLDQLEKLDKENKELIKRGLPTVGPNPFGSPVNNQGGTNENPADKAGKGEEPPKKVPPEQ
jgi:mRNA-degrading endonuclease RelE of RelBE toxin-antitoxin system